MIYQGRRIRLRACTPADADLFAIWAADSSFLRYQPAFAVEEDFPSWWVRRLTFLADMDFPPEIEAIIEHVPSGEAIGSVMLTSIDMQLHGKAEISLYFNRGRHTRCVWEAFHAAMVGAFGKLCLRKLIFHVDKSNSETAHLLERLGVEREGVLREEILVGGKAHDVLRFGMLAHEWRAQDGARAWLERLAPLADNGFSA